MNKKNEAQQAKKQIKQNPRNESEADERDLETPERHKARRSGLCSASKETVAAFSARREYIKKALRGSRVEGEGWGAGGWWKGGEVEGWRIVGRRVEGWKGG